MPQAHEQSWGEPRLPVRLRRDRGVHEPEQPRGVVLYFDVDVELDVGVLGLCGGSIRVGRAAGGISEVGGGDVRECRERVNEEDKIRTKKREKERAVN